MKFGTISAYSSISWPYQVNVGDAAQCMATQKLLRKHFNYDGTFDYVERDRDLLNCATLQPMTVVCNGWYRWANFKRYVTFTKKDVNYVLTGIHIFDELDRSMLLKVFGRDDVVVGCRDGRTLSLLQKHGFKRAYLSACMTMLFNKRKNVEDDIVYIVDVSNSKKYTTEYKDRKTVVCTNVLDKKKYSNWTLVMEECENRYERWMRTASLVVTSRLHVYLPCVAMGIPVRYVGVNEGRTEATTIQLEKKIEDLKPLSLQMFKNAVNGVYDEKLCKEFSRLYYMEV